MAKKQRPSRRFRGDPVKKAVILAVSLVILVCLGLWLWSGGPAFPRLEVGGYRISQEEYLRVLYQARNDVLSDHAAAGISLRDWSAETPLGDPRQMTMDRTLEILSEYYAVSTLAVERGYLSDAGYDSMLQDMEDINRQRQEALDSGAVVTGFPQFTAADYITYRASSLRLQFTDDPANPENQVTEDEILARYEADRDNLYLQPDSLDLQFLVANNADDALAAEFEILRQKAMEIGDLSAALEQMPQLKAYYQEILVEPATYGSYSRSHGDVLSCADGLQSGDISVVFRQEDWLCLIQCDQRTVHRYVPLEDVRSIVIQSIRESRYDALIAERTADLQIRGDLDKLYRFTAEQLP